MEGLETKIRALEEHLEAKQADLVLMGCETDKLAEVLRDAENEAMTTEAELIQSNIDYLQVRKSHIKPRTKMIKSASGKGAMFFQMHSKATKLEQYVHTCCHENEELNQLVDELQEKIITIQQKLSDDKSRFLSEKEKFRLHMNDVKSHFLQNPYRIKTCKLRKELIDEQKKLGTLEPVISMQQKKQALVSHISSTKQRIEEKTNEITLVKGDIQKLQEKELQQKQSRDTMFSFLQREWHELKNKTAETEKTLTDIRGKRQKLASYLNQRGMSTASNSNPGGDRNFGTIPTTNRTQQGEKALATSSLNQYSRSMAPFIYPATAGVQFAKDASTSGSMQYDFLSDDLELDLNDIPDFDSQTVNHAISAAADSAAKSSSKHYSTQNIAAIYAQQKQNNRLASVGQGTSQGRASAKKNTYTKACTRGRQKKSNSQATTLESFYSAIGNQLKL